MVLCKHWFPVGLCPRCINEGIQNLVQIYEGPLGVPEVEALQKAVGVSTEELKTEVPE